MRRQNISIFLTLGVSAAAIFTVLKLRSKKQVCVKTRVLGFRVEDLHTEFEDDLGEVYNSTELMILSPLIFKGRVVQVYHSQDQEIDSLWRKIGANIHFNASKYLLKQALKKNLHILSEGLKIQNKD